MRFAIEPTLVEDLQVGDRIRECGRTREITQIEKQDVSSIFVLTATVKECDPRIDMIYALKGDMLDRVINQEEK
jgi:hypothetical protein